jgi:hypothetical protein
MMNRSTEINRLVEPEARPSIPPARRATDLSRRLLGDALVTSNRALLLGWARLELDRQLAELEPTRDEDEAPF